MTGKRRSTGLVKQLPEWLVHNKSYLKDHSHNPDKPSWYLVSKKFGDPKPARRYANLMEKNHHQTQLIEVVVGPGLPKQYWVYIRDVNKK